MYTDEKTINTRANTCLNSKKVLSRFTGRAKWAEIGENSNKMFYFNWERVKWLILKSNRMGADGGEDEYKYS